MGIHRLWHGSPRVYRIDREGTKRQMNRSNGNGPSDGSSHKKKEKKNTKHKVENKSAAQGSTYSERPQLDL